MFSKKIKNLMPALIFACSILTLDAYADVVVIVHPNNNTELNTALVKKIFLGKTKIFSDGTKAVPIELIKGNQSREDFLTNVLRKSDSSLNSYWSRMMFTGKASPPKAYDSDEDVKTLISKNPSLIGYIDSSLVDDSVRVVTLD